MIALPSFRSISSSLHPTAVAYASTVGLTALQTMRLSRHLFDIAAAGVVPVQLTLGRSEWLARNGSSWRAVIGNPATITGTVTNATEGQQFPGTSGNYARLNNPLQSAALTELGMMAVARAATGTTSQYPLTGYNGTLSQWGPSMVLNASPRQGSIANRLYADFSPLAASGTLSGANSQKAVNTGGMLALGIGFEPNANPWIMAGGWTTKSSSGTIATLWNNGATWGIGGRPDLTTALTGAVSYALVSSNTLTADRYAAVYSSGLKHGIFQTEATSVVVGLGDSLMEGIAPATHDTNLLGKLVGSATGGAWQNAASADNEGIGGSTITSVEGVQKSGMLRWARADGFTNRWVVHFGAHNDAGYQSSDEATRNALMERYIVVWQEAQSLGAKIAIVSPMDGAGGTSEQYAASAAYRTRLATRCAEEGFAYVNLHADPDFSVAARNPAYFTDVTHLSVAGYTRATELFVAAIASPDFEP